MRFEKKTAILLIAIFMISAFAVAVPVMAIEGTHLISTGAIGTGNEDRIVIEMPEGFTLGDLGSIFWKEWLVRGYPPHVDVILDLDGGGYGPGDDALVFEYAYNTLAHYAENNYQMPFGAVIGTWSHTFRDDENGLAVIDDAAMAWATKGAPGPFDPNDPMSLSDDFHFYSLADWKGGVTYTANGQPEKTIDSDSIVLRLEIEVDNWVVDTEAYVKDIVVKGSGGSTVGLVGISGGYTLTVDIEGLGTVDRTAPTDGGVYAHGTTVTLDALPATNWHLKEWSGALGGSVDPKNLLMNGDKQVTATFELDIVSIDVDRISVDFDEVIMGTQSDVEIVTVTNDGNVLVEVNAEVIPDGGFFDTYLRMNSMGVDPWSGATFQIAIGASRPVNLQLDLRTCTTVGTYADTLVFWAEQVTP